MPRAFVVDRAGQPRSERPSVGAAPPQQLRELRARAPDVGRAISERGPSNIQVDAHPLRQPRPEADAGAADHADNEGRSEGVVGEPNLELDSTEEPP